MERGSQQDPGDGALSTDATAATTGASVLRGGAWNFASRVVPQLYVAVLSIAAARFLGPDDFGRQSFIAFTQISLVLLLTAGITEALVRFVGDSMGRGDRAATRGLLAWTVRIEFFGGMAGAAILVAVALAGADPQAAWFLAAAVTALNTTYAVFRAFLDGLQNWKFPAVVGLAVGAASTVATVAVLAAGGGIVGMFAVEAAAAAVSLIVLGRIAIRTARGLAPEPRLEPGYRSEVLRYSLVAWATSVLSYVVWRRTELFFLEGFSTDEQIGFYSIAFTAATVLALIFQSVATVMLPAMATLHGAGQMERVKSGFRRAQRLMLCIALPTTAAALAFGPELIRVVYGQDYSSVEPVVLVLLAITPILPLVTLSGSLLAALGRLRPMLIWELIASVVNVGIAFLLIPELEAVGAAIGNVTAQLVAGIPLLVIASSIVGSLDWRPRATTRVLLTSVVAGLLGWALVTAIGGVAGLTAGVAASAMTFTAGGSILKFIEADDAEWLDEALGHHLNGWVGRAVRHWALRPSRK